MLTLLPLVAVCVLSFAPKPASAQIIAVPGEASPAQPIVPPVPPLGQRMAPALKLRMPMPARRPDGRRDPEERRILLENETITDYNIKNLDAWLEALAESEWAAEDRAAAETAIVQLKAEYTALADIRSKADFRLPRLSLRRLQKPLMPEQVGVRDPEVRLANLRGARYNFLATKANLVEAEAMPDSRQDVETARKYHESAAEILSRIEAREQESRSGAAEGVRKAREALKGAAGGAPDPD